MKKFSLWISIANHPHPCSQAALAEPANARLLQSRNSCSTNQCILTTCWPGRQPSLLFSSHGSWLQISSSRQAAKIDLAQHGHFSTTLLFIPLGRHSTHNLYEFTRWPIFSRWPPWGDLCVGIPTQLLLVIIIIIFFLTGNFVRTFTEKLLHGFLWIMAHMKGLHQEWCHLSFLLA